MRIDFSDLCAAERYKIVAGLIVPRPIAWISTVGEDGTPNCAPFSFFNVMSDDPALCVVSINLRDDGSIKDTLRNIHRTGEFVVNLVDERHARAMHVTSAPFAAHESEFVAAGLTPTPATRVAAPRIGEALASLECRVWHIVPAPPRHEFVFGEMLVAHLADDIFDPRTRRVDLQRYHPVGRLCGTLYCTTREQFELPDGAVPAAGSASGRRAEAPR